LPDEDVGAAGLEAPAGSRIIEIPAEAEAPAPGETEALREAPPVSGTEAARRPALSGPPASPARPAPSATARIDTESPPAGLPASGEDEAYRAAFNLLKSGQYEKSVAAFSDFLARYPNSGRADNAQYWLAEAHYVAHQYQPAIAAYTKLVQNYPESQKLTHAMLKIGYSYHELGQLAEAQSSLENLRVRYPGTTAAQLAEERLQRIRVEQH
jgi:tol-pal system protein YbgF